MKISIITTITNPDKNQYAWREAIKSYFELADEVIIVNGGEIIDPKSVNFLIDGEEPGVKGVKIIDLPWPAKWHWSELPVHLNAGLEAATGDWVIKTDIDYIFHENDIKDIRHALENDAKGFAVAAFVKKAITDRHHYYKKCRVAIAINKGNVGDTIKFGIDIDEKTDWCFPILVNKSIPLKYGKVPRGKSVPSNMIFDTGLNVWDYDCFFRTKEVQKKVFWPFAQAYATVFDKSWGDTEEAAWKVWLDMMKGRRTKKLYPMDIDSHPKFIKERIKSMNPEEFGFDNFDNFKDL